MLVNVEYYTTSMIFDIINAIPQWLIRCIETGLSASSVRGITYNWNDGLPKTISRTT